MSSILRIEHVTKAFGGNTAVNDVSAEVERGEIMGLIGPNGAGKTTLFNCISGYHTATSGQIFFHGTEITRKKPFQICKRGIVRTFQIVQPFGQLTLLENVMVGAYNHTKDRAKAKEHAMQFIEFVGLQEKAGKVVGELNIGDQRKVEMARALATQPELLLLDEIMAGLTPTETGAVMDLIRKIRESGITVFMVEHIMSAVMGLSDRIMVLVQGRLTILDRPEIVANNPEVIEAYIGVGNTTDTANIRH